MGLLKIVLFALIAVAALYFFYKWKYNNESKQMQNNVKVLESQIESEYDEKGSSEIEPVPNSGSSVPAN
jgi:type II secretory pathway pseudopilin PulG